MGAVLGRDVLDLVDHVAAPELAGAAAPLEGQRAVLLLIARGGPRVGPPTLTTEASLVALTNGSRPL